MEPLRSYFKFRARVGYRQVSFGAADVHRYHLPDVFPLPMGWRRHKLASQSNLFVTLCAGDPQGVELV